jgi:hypothetical protein
MARIRLDSNTGVDDCIYEIEDNLIDENIEAELNTVKNEYVRNCIDYDYQDGIDADGNRYTEIWECGGDNYTRWTVLNGK